MEDWNQKEPSPTGGVTMSLSISRPDEQSYEIFRVTRQGALEYGGGMAAFNDRTNWSGAMTSQEIDAFLALLDRVGWCETEPEGDRASSIRCRIELRCTERRRTWAIRGEPASVTEMRAMLEPIARRRFQPDLDRLPEPTELRPSGSAATSSGGGDAASERPNDGDAGR